MNRVVLAFVFIAIFTSCEKDYPIGPEKVEIEEASGNYSSGVFIINEGNFQFGNASISFYNRDTIENNIFENVNGLPIGDIAQDIFISGNKAYIVIDITGGMGVATARKLQELGYRDLYVEGANTADKWKYNPKLLEKIPGITFNNKRSQIISAFEEALRHGFNIKSHRLLNELYTFVFVNGKPDHMKGKHDDLIMAMAMALYVGESSFSQLKKSDDMTKAMLNSWVESTEDKKETIVDLRPIHNSETLNPRIRPYVNNEQLYREYSWLFGGGKKR